MTARAKPPMPKAIRPFVDKARERHKRRPPHPGVEVVDAGGGRWTFGAPHRDFEEWEVQIFDAFGTRSKSACLFFLEQLSAFCPGTLDANGRWRPNEHTLNAILAIVSGARPRNEMEAAHAAQMVAVHLMAMKTSAMALKALEVDWLDHRTIAVASNLGRTFSAQGDTLLKMKGRTARQKITVKYERHDHHHEHKHIHADIEEGVQDFGGRPHEPRNRAPAIEHESRPALPGPDPAGDSVPVSGGAGSETLSPPRRRQGVRRASRRAQRRVQDGGMDERGGRAEADRVGGDEGGQGGA